MSLSSFRRLKPAYLFFGHHCPAQIKQKVMNSLNVYNVALQSTYLGMPTYVGQSKVNTFNFISERTWKRVQGWNDRPMSRAGKEIMLKSVAQAIPTYVMSCFRLPDSICENLRATISNHWWGFEGGKKKMHWRSWDWLTTPKFLGGMGFRDMKLFNQAMLGRQCWRLLTSPDSLCARVLKGRYYPKCSFMDSGVTRSCSFTWRSLMFGKSLLERGIFWRVGDGKEIRIIKDRWVPGVPCHPIHPIVQMPDDLKVSSLIDESSKQWNVELIRICFNPADAEHILNIPLSHNRVSDFVSWPYTKTGAYTVKSAYIMVKCAAAYLKESVNGKGGSSNQAAIAGGWKRIWSINAPPKMKIVLWRFAHDCLPTGHQLRRRNISTCDLCCHCGRHETIEHTFISCQYVAEIWRELKKRSGFKSLVKYFGSPRDWISQMLAGCTEMEATILVIAIWHIWESRNAVRNGKNEVHPHCIVEKILAYVDMVLLHMFKPVPSNRCDSPRRKKWDPPPEGWVMVNVDAAVFQRANRMGMGIVIRNHKSEFLAAYRQGLDRIIEPELAEAFAFRQAVTFALGLNYKRAIIASDCLSLVQKLHFKTLDRSNTGIIVEDIKKMACIPTVALSFVHISRCCNEVPHVLARSADQLVEKSWFHVPPEFLWYTLCNDL